MNIILGIVIAMRTRAEMGMGTRTRRGISEKERRKEEEDMYLRRAAAHRESGGGGTHTAATHPPLGITRRSTPVALRTAATSPQSVSQKCLGGSQPSTNSKH